MKKYLLALFAFTLSFNAFALDLGLGKDEKSSGGDVDGQVKEFVGKSEYLAIMANKSLVAINSAFASEEEVAKKKAELTRIQSITDPKEKGAALDKLNQSESAEAAKNLKSADAEQKIKSLSDEKKKQMGSALLNFGIASLSAPSLLDKGQKIVSSVSMTSIAKVLPVKNALPLLQRFVSDGTGTIAGFVKVAKGANISIPEAKADSKPADFEI